MTVLEDPTDWPTPNYGPKLKEFVEEVTLTPGVDEKITVGIPEDPEGHAFYVRGWEI